MKTALKIIRKNLFGAVVALPVALPLHLEANEITVPSGSILTIQQGVDAAAPGDMVIVLSGTYFGPVFIGQEKTGLKLKAAGTRGSVRVVGGGVGGGGIAVRADYASVEGFDVSGFSIGIIIDSWPLRITEGVQLAHNSVHDCHAGIAAGSAANAEIAFNKVEGAADAGIGVGQSTAVHVHHNQAVDVAPGAGILLSGSSDCEVDHNLLSGNRHGIRIQPDGSGLANANNHLHHNKSNANISHGISLYQAPACQLDHNEANGNGGAGIDVGVSPDCVVAFNDADRNGQYGIAVTSSCGTAFAHNSAEGNGQFDLFAPDWHSPATCNTYLKNSAGTAWPSLSLWDVK